MHNDETLATMIYSLAHTHNVNCTKVVVLENEIEPYRVYVVANERSSGLRSSNQWHAFAAYATLKEAEKMARNISDNCAGAHYLGHGPW